VECGDTDGRAEPVPGPFGDAPVVLVVGDGSTTPQQDMELTTELLAAFARPEVEGRLRVHSPRPTAAFSRIDALAGGFPAARSAALARGFAPVVRPAGGRLAAYHEGALVLDLVARHPDARRQFRERFAPLGEHLAAGLRTLGVPAQVGAVPGEYCPGEFSVHAGATKLVGTAQRLTRHGYLFSAVILVTDPEPVRTVLVDAYAALGLDWRPASVGAVADHVPGVTVADVADMVLPGLRELIPGLRIPERPVD
jgi:octanoyl-[GcvH]:protein N-octanoyltransferase